MTRPTCYASGDGPGLAAWDLAYERLAAEDEKRSAWLNERIGWSLREKPKCPGPDCERVAVTKGLCSSHYMQRLRGEPLTTLQTKAPRTTKPR